jgi:hypothetical protein
MKQTKFEKTDSITISRNHTGTLKKVVGFQREKMDGKSWRAHLTGVDRQKEDQIQSLSNIISKLFDNLQLNF